MTPGTEGTLSVLLVEDNEGDANLIETHLERVDDPLLGSDIHIEHVESLTAAQEHLASEHLDVVLLDLGLPESKGLETVERVLDHHPSLAVVVLTGLDDETVALGALAAGAQDYLDKDRHIQGDVLARSLRYAIERKDRERELERRTRRLTDLANVVSHELRNPLTIAKGYADLAREGEESEELGRVVESLERMEVLVDKLVDLSRPGDAGGAERVDLGTLCRECWGGVSTPEDTLHVDGDLGTVVAEPERVRTLFLHLLQNAVEHAGPSVDVRVGALPDGFYIEDDGPGLAPEERGDIFERTQSSGGGTGTYGLAIVRNIVEDYGWEVAITESDTGGARFEVRGVEELSDTTESNGEEP